MTLAAQLVLKFKMEILSQGFSPLSAFAQIN